MSIEQKARTKSRVGLKAVTGAMSTLWAGLEPREPGGFSDDIVLAGFSLRSVLDIDAGKREKKKV